MSEPNPSRRFNDRGRMLDDYLKMVGQISLAVTSLGGFALGLGLLAVSLHS